jgi:glycosyltransferase involved in cell wall biosynthesis
MAMEKTVVGTPYSFSGIKGCVHGQNMIQAENPYEFATAITNLLYDSDKRRKIGRNARLLVKNNYSWEKTADSFEELYAEVIAKSGRPGRKIDGAKIIIQEAAVCRK